MALTLHLRSDSGLPLDVAGILPERFKESSPKQAAKQLVRLGKGECELGDMFDVAGDRGDGTIVWEGSLKRVVNLGASMSEGVMIVRGSIGRGLGREMSGGRIDVHGNAGDEAGARMRGGTIWIHGDAGDRAGAADLGHRYGMRGGTIVIDGNAGDDLGRGIRRGAIVVKGSCRAGVMTDAVAGTVIVCGECGARPCGGMERGSLVLLGTKPPDLLPSFVAGRSGRPTFLKLLFADLARLGVEIDPANLLREFRQYHGDLLRVGLGEIFVAAG